MTKRLSIGKRIALVIVSPLVGLTAGLTVMLMMIYEGVSAESLIERDEP